MTNHHTSIRALGEIVLRVRDLDRMEAFYRDVVGLEPLRRFGDDQSFFRIAQGFEGHTTILALFVERWPSNRTGHTWQGHDPSRTTLNHFAFTISLEDYDVVIADLKGKGVDHNTTTHAWVGWRSIYFHDPEENVVELVCFDSSVLQQDS